MKRVFWSRCFSERQLAMPVQAACQKINRRAMNQSRVHIHPELGAMFCPRLAALFELIKNGFRNLEEFFIFFFLTKV